MRDYKAELLALRAAIKHVKGYPQKGSPRRTKDGFPAEFCYDEFAYKRMVRSIRNALGQILSEKKHGGRK